MQLLHDPIELRLRQGGVEEIGDHLPLVRRDELLVPGESSVPAHQVAHVPAVGGHEDVALLADDVVDGS